MTKPKPPELHKPRGGRRTPGPGKRIGRPPIVGEARDKPIQVMVTSTEKAALDAHAAIQRLSVPEMIRRYIAPLLRPPKPPQP